MIICSHLGEPDLPRLGHADLPWRGAENRRQSECRRGFDSLDGERDLLSIVLQPVFRELTILWNVLFRPALGTQLAF